MYICPDLKPTRTPLQDEILLYQYEDKQIRHLHLVQKPQMKKSQKDFLFIHSRHSMKVLLWTFLNIPFLFQLSRKNELLMQFRHFHNSRSMNS